MKELHYFVQTSFFELYEFELQRVELWWGNDGWVSLSSLSKKQQQIIWLQHKQILSFFYTRDNQKTCGAYSHCGPIRNIYGWVFFLIFIIVFVGSIQNSNYRKNNSDDNNNNNNTNNNTNYSSNSYNGNNSNTGIVTGIITTIAVIIPLRNDCIYCPLYCSFSQKNDFLLCVCKY